MYIVSICSTDYHCGMRYVPGRGRQIQGNVWALLLRLEQFDDALSACPFAKTARALLMETDRHLHIWKLYFREDGKEGGAF